MLYEAPKNEFVRDFLGKTLLFKGRVRSSNPEGQVAVALEAASDSVIFGRNYDGQGIKTGKLVHLAIRPEDVQILPATASELPAGMIGGIAHTALFLGDQIEYQVEVEGQGTVMISGERHNPVEEGARVWLKLRPDGHSVNTTLASPAEFKSYSDLLNPKWKGKIVALDPRRPGNAANLTVFLYATPGLGRDFLKRLFGEMDVVFSHDRYQVVDWLARGKFAVNLFSPVSKEDIKAGLPLMDVKVDGPAPLGAGAASASLLNRAPHPNTARLFLNWVLSREGQIAYQKASENNSLRTDIPKKDLVEPGEIPEEGREYFFYSLEENDKKQQEKEFKQFLNEIIPRK